ncbi:MAG: alpha/beta fold hydrolase [Gemmatimonadota bacterium]
MPGRSPRTAVVICHGFKGFREWGFFPSLARAVARRGHAAITFDFSHNGVGDDGVDFSALDRFATNTHSRNVDEIKFVLDALESGLFPVAPDRVALIGHSRGGAEAVLAAGEDRRVDALVTWSAISSVEGRWSSEQIAAWERGQTAHITNSRTRQEMPIGSFYWRDIVENRERLDVLGSAARLRIPWLIVHGEADETVPVSDAHTLFSAAGEDAELCLIEAGSHTFGAKHPYDGPTPELRTAVQTTLSWLDGRLS